MIDLLLTDFIEFHGVKDPIGPHTYEKISRFGLRSSDLEIYPYMYGGNLPKKNRNIDHKRRKRSILYNRKFMIGSKNRFLTTDQLFMIENQFLIGITIVFHKASANFPAGTFKIFLPISTFPIFQLRFFYVSCLVQNFFIGYLPKFFPPIF